MPARPDRRGTRRLTRQEVEEARRNRAAETSVDAIRARGDEIRRMRTLLENARRTRASYPTKVNPNKNEHWTGLSKDERTLQYDRWGRTLNSGGDAPMPRYVTSRRDYDGREQVERTHAQRYKDLRAAFNVT